MDGPAAVSQQRLSTASQVGDALLTIANLELGFAADQLSALSTDRDESVHQCRKAIKRLRALAQLGIGVPGANPRPIDRRLRDAGRLLARTRDTTAVAKVLARLVESDPALTTLKRVERIDPSGQRLEISADRVSNKLGSVRARFPALFTNAEAWTFARMSDGIEATYAAVAAGMNKLERKHSDKRAHAWRKDVQRLLHQLGVIETLCPDFLGPPLQQLSELSDVLGEHHDLVVLRERLEARREKLPTKTVAAVTAAAKTRRRELRRRALEIAAPLLRPSPHAFRDSLLGSCGTRLTE